MQTSKLCGKCAQVDPKLDLKSRELLALSRARGVDYFCYVCGEVHSLLDLKSDSIRPIVELEEGEVEQILIPLTT